MSLYHLPEIKIPRLKSSSLQKGNGFFIALLIFAVFVSGGLGGILTGEYLPELKEFIFGIKTAFPQQNQEYIPATTQEESIINAVKSASPAVVSIIISKDIPIIEQYFTTPFPLFPEFQVPQYRQEGTERQEVGGGTGFIVSEDGLILTNKHVVSDENAFYTVLTNNGNRYSAKVLALDPTQDLALIGLEDAFGLPTILLGDSDNLQIGQTVITIGNALGEFRNTVSAGVVSGLSRTITASGGGVSETIEGVIQTDAAINSGNSGGPLLNLKGEVIGINTAMVSGAQNIGFAIPINKAKRDIEQVRKTGEISYPFLGVRYVIVNDAIQESSGLAVNFGAWIRKGENDEPAVGPDSPAQEAGLQEGDIILEFNGEKITTENTLAEIIVKYNPEDVVELKILREEEEFTVSVELDKR